MTKRKNQILITAFNQTHDIPEWSQIYGIQESIIRDRYKAKVAGRSTMSFEDIVRKPSRKTVSTGLKRGTVPKKPAKTVSDSERPLFDIYSKFLRCRLHAGGEFKEVI